MFKNLLADPLARGPDIDNPRCTVIRWSIIQKKPFLQQIYEEWYSAISALLLLPQNPVLELESGGGFLSDYIPGLITSEVCYYQHVGVILNGSSLPLQKNR
jgi:hypothetical protein